MRTAVGLALTLIVSLGAAADDNPSWMYLLRADAVVIADPATGDISDSIALPHTGAAGLYPTPGGKFVFVTYLDRSDVTAIDAETHEISRVPGLDFVPDFVGFSAMGDVAFFTSSSDGIVRRFAHRRAVFSDQENLPVGDVAAPILVNRRATRIYRNSQNSLDFVYIKTGEVIESVRVPGGISALGMSPDYRTIWAVAKSDGSLRVIDEGRGRVAEAFNTTHSGYTPRFLGSLSLLLAGDGESVRAYGTRRLRFQRQIDLPAKAEGFAVSEEGLIWSYGSQGVAITDLETGESRVSLDLSGVVAISYVVVRSGEGYACF